MGQINVNVTGNGTAYVSNSTPMDGESVTLYAYPDSGETLDDVYAIESHGYSVAIAPEQPFIYSESWGTLDIYVVFSGTQQQFPIWLLFKIRKRKVYE